MVPILALFIGFVISLVHLIWILYTVNRFLVPKGFIISDSDCNIIPKSVLGICSLIENAFSTVSCLKCN